MLGGPATSTNTKGSLYGSLLYWSNGLGERLLQTASDFLFSNLLVRFDELAIGEFGVHPSYARRSRHFDPKNNLRTVFMRLPPKKPSPRLQRRTRLFIFISLPRQRQAETIAHVAVIVIIKIVQNILHVFLTGLLKVGVGVGAGEKPESL